MIDGELAAGQCWEFLRDRRDRALAAGAKGCEQGRNCDVGLASDHHIDRWQALIIHAPTIVQMVIDRDLHDFGRDIAAETLKGAGNVDPVEAEDDVG